MAELRFLIIRDFFGRNPKNFKLFSSQNYFKEPQSKYLAAGDFNAVLLTNVTLITTIGKIFGDKKIHDFHSFSDETIQSEYFGSNIFSIGGPKFNKVTKSIISKYNESISDFPINFEENKIVVKWTDNKGVKIDKKFERKEEKNKSTEDYGVLGAVAK